MTPLAGLLAKIVRRLGRYRLLAGILSISALASAEQEATSVVERVQVRYTAGDGCPTSQAFVEEVAARVRRPLEWVREDATMRVDVELVPSMGAVVGRLELTRASGPPARREMEAGTCAEVSSALALIVALVLDPNARTEPLSSEPAPDHPPPPRDRARDEPEPQPAPAPAPATASSAHPRWRLYFGPAAAISSGYVSTRLVTIGAAVGAHSTARHWLAPLAQLTPSWGRTGTTGPAVSQATFEWILLRFDACPTRLALSPTVALLPCVTVEGGSVSARGDGEQIDVAMNAVRAWAAVGPSLSLRVSTGSWFAAVSASALAPLTRHQFVFLEPLETIHEVPPVVFGAQLSLGHER